MKPWTFLALLACTALLLTPACKKKDGEAKPATDAAADDGAPPPPDPPPPLVDAELTLDGWKLKLKVPEGFETFEQEPGVWRTPGATMTVRLGCGTPCEPDQLVAKSADLVAGEIEGWAADMPDGSKQRPQIQKNEREAEGRYVYEVAVPAGGGLLADPSLAGAVLLFQDGWKKYVVCEWNAALETAPTFRPALDEACRALAVELAGL
jgi:hypothetical protein